MKEKSFNARCIVEFIEFKVAVPSSLTLHKMLYSDYKSHISVKVLVGIVPGGGFSFVLSAFPGSISDKSIKVKSGLEPRNELMEDCGFTVEEYLTPLGVKLLGRSQFNEQEIVKSQQIANEWIHVERMNQRLKCYDILDRVIPPNMIDYLNQIISVCSILSNFQEPILKNSNITY